MTRYWKAGAYAAALAALGMLFAVPGSAKAVRGEFPPDFTGTALDGRKVTLSAFRGKNPVVLNFYADFCGPCKEEYPHLKQIDEKFSEQGLRVVSVSLDEDRETASRIPNQNKVKFPVIFDPKGGIAEKYAVRAIPHTVIIGKDGKVQQIITGLDLELLDKAVADALK